MKLHLQKYDKQLKSFEVSKALDTALQVNAHLCGYKTFHVWYDCSDEDISICLCTFTQTWGRTHKPDVTVAVIMELNRRGTLKNALAGRNEESLTKILSFLLKSVTVLWLKILIQNILDSWTLQNVKKPNKKY